MDSIKELVTELDAAKAEIRMLRERVALLSTPDIYWKVDSLEHGVFSRPDEVMLSEVCASNSMGDEIRVAAARQLPGGYVRIVGEDVDQDGNDIWLVNFFSD